MTIISSWRAADVARIAGAAPPSAPPIVMVAPVENAGTLGFWDAWPVQDRTGAPSVLADGSTLWMVLAAPRAADPDERHGIARIHLVQRTGSTWRYVAPAMPDGFSPGSREWSGSAVLDDDGATLTLYFTAAGFRGEAETSFVQRLFSAQCTLVQAGAAPACTGWRNLREIVTRDPQFYMGFEGGGAIGTIKAFRDPAYFHDAANGRDYLFFAGSRAGSAHACNGVIGAAARAADGSTDWSLLPPIVSADGLNNELERPHVIRHGGLHYLFWSTQAHVFTPDGPRGPTGLYGMASRDLLSGWEPLNRSGLVFSNPPAAPAQAYSWLVLPDLSVTSFVDQWGVATPPRKAKRFGGSFAPFLHLQLDGLTARLVEAG